MAENNFCQAFQNPVQKRKRKRKAIAKRYELKHKRSKSIRTHEAILVHYGWFEIF